MDHQGIKEVYDYTYDHLGRKKSFRHTKNGFAQNIAQYDYDDIGRINNKTFSPVGTNITTAQTGLWTDNTTWQGGNLPTLKDVARINSGHSITINNGETVSAGLLVANINSNIINNGTIVLGPLATSPASTPLLAINYQYHIRGGLRGINLDGAGNLTNSLFSYKLGFEDDGSYFDGNIRKQEWRSSMDNNTRSFTYSYDAASRIKSGAFVGNGAENYSLINVNYDENGNISALSRNGFKANNTFGQVDNLSYIYFGNSNKIQQVDDLSGEAASLSDSPGTDYTYYPDGSLQSDANKGISLIEYNYLKLPKRIVMGSTTILNQYDAGGKKLKETIGTNTRDYVDNLVFENGTLQQLSHDEGRLVGTTHEYYIKDHLGSLRVAFKDSAGVAKITQKHDYGIWGEILPTLSYKNTAKLDPYRFTGKEALTETGFIDFGARLFDNVVPRFISVDPLADITKNLSSSSFAYVANNPISRIDPDGKDWFYYQTLGEKKKSWHWQDGNVATYTNTKGKTVSTKNGFDYLVTFKITGKNSEGSTTGILQVWGDRDPKKGALITSTGFTGSSKFQGTEPIPKGNYMMKLGKRDSDGPNGFKQDESGPIPFDGIQAIPNNEKFVHNGYVYPNNPWFTNAYGNGRIRLNQTDENLNPIPMINQPAGYYLHGKKDAHNWTHGCICDKSEAIFNFLWKSQIRVNVPFNVD